MTNKQIQSGQGNVAIIDSDYSVGSAMQDADIFCVNAAPITITIEVANQAGMSFNFINRSAHVVTVVSGAGEQFVGDASSASMPLPAGMDARVVYDTIDHAWRVCHAISPSGGAGSVQSVNGMTGEVILTTAEVNENTNLYYTSARFDAAFAAKFTTNLPEGTNLYYTDLRAAAAAPVQSVAGRTGAVLLAQADIAGLTAASSPTFAAVNAVTFSGALAGNASTATILQTARNINGVSFNGSANITVVDATKEPLISTGTTGQYWRGDKSWQTLDKTAVGLSNVDNTSDLGKPVSTATAAALALKEDSIAAGTTAQYYRGDKSWQTLNKTAVGLANVDNTSDVNKPVSTAQAAADAVVLSSANAYANSLVVGLWDDRGGYDASGNTFPASGGSGSAGAVLKGDIWMISVPGALGGVPVAARQTVRALIDAPAQTAANWSIALANTDIDDSITDGVTGRAPSQNAVFDALALKEGSIAAGTTAQYYRGDKSWQTLDKAAVGLANVDNTSDANKPVSTATSTALGLKEGTVTAGTTAQYYRGDKSWQTLDKISVGLANVDNTSDANKPVSTATSTALGLKEGTIAAGTTAQYYRGDKSWQTLDKVAVGLTNVDNTTDANKPVSSATSTALALKANLTGASFSGDILLVSPAVLATSDNKNILYPETGYYTTGTASITGAFEIILPVITSGNAFVNFEVLVIENVTGRHFRMNIGGFITGASSTWNTPSAFMIGAHASKTPSVRFGNDGVNPKVWIGELADTWTYPQVYVSNVKIGGAVAVNSWRAAWAVAPVLAFDTIDQGPTVPVKSADLVSPAFTGTPTVPTAAVNTSTTQAASTAYVVAQIADDAPTKTGVNASGLWPITAAMMGSYDGGTLYGGTVLTAVSRSAISAPSWYNRSVSFEFKDRTALPGGGGFAGNYTGLMTLAPNIGTTASGFDPTYQLAFSPSAASATTLPDLKFRAGIDAAWGAWYTMIHSGNYAAQGIAPLASPTFTGALTASGSFATSAIATKTGNYSMVATDTSLIFNGGAGITLTLQSAATYPGRWLYVKNIAAFAVISASSNVIPQAGGAAGTAILAATAGKWAVLQSDGTNWQIMMSN